MCPFCAEYPVTTCRDCEARMFSFNGDDEREARDDSTVPPSQCDECGGDPHHTASCPYILRVAEKYAALKRIAIQLTQADGAKR